MLKLFPLSQNRFLRGLIDQSTFNVTYAFPKHETWFVTASSTSSWKDKLQHNLIIIRYHHFIVL